MGLFINPGNEGFRTVRNGKYVDKSGMIAEVNKTLNSAEKLSLISRPRRFGKSFAAKMLCAYYDNSVDSSSLFSDLEIAGDPSYKTHLNQYNVLLLDITGFAVEAPNGVNLPNVIRDSVARDIKRIYPDIDTTITIPEMLTAIVEKTGKKFFAVIDEWDSPIRDSTTTPQTQRIYLEFLRSLFKNQNVTDKIFVGAYMTGILPVKKDGSQSAISEFIEYTILDSDNFDKYIGFTEDEVKNLCIEFNLDFEQMKRWYDGYSSEHVKSIYNPYAVMQVVRSGEFRSYWKQSSAADSLLQYLNMNFDGLAEDALELLRGKNVHVNIRTFKNDLISFGSRDDVLTLLIHFGYLCYDKQSGTVRIPNEEIRMEFEDTMRQVSNVETLKRVKESEELLKFTAQMKADEVAKAIEKVHNEECNPLFYNNEQALRSVVKMAYFAYRDKYVCLEELAGGKGYADMVFMPKLMSGMPALVIELKADGTSAQSAIDQIREKNFPAPIQEYLKTMFTDINYCGILLVGIVYDKTTKKHSCHIELTGIEGLDD